MWQIRLIWNQKIKNVIYIDEKDIKQTLILKNIYKLQIKNWILYFVLIG